MNEMCVRSSRKHLNSPSRGDRGAQRVVIGQEKGGDRVTYKAKSDP